jgi:hypothetical protein
LVTESRGPSGKKSLMTSQGTAHGRFERAIAKRHLHAAESAARELGQLSLVDALAFLLLLAEREPARFGRAAVRWHARFALDAKGLDVEESQLALAAVAALRKPAGVVSAGPALERLAATHGLLNVSQALRRLPR